MRGAGDAVLMNHELASSLLRVAVVAFALSTGCQSATLTGTWTGTFTSPSSVRVRFVLEQQAGRLRGQTYWEDPNTRALEPEAGELRGAVTDGGARWKTQGEVDVEGRFDGNTFVGTLTFPAVDDQPSRTAALKLER